MAALTNNNIFGLEWFARVCFAGIDAKLHDRPAMVTHERWLIGSLAIALLDAEREAPDFRLASISGFFAFCQPMLKRSHAQIFQDLWVLYMLSSKRDGYFVEFGACDGHLLSNTRLLEEEYDWKGILAEPNPAWHTALRQNRKVIIDTDCVAGSSGEVVDFLSTDAQPELSRMADIVPDDVHERNGNRSVQSLHQVSTVSLNDLLDRHDAPEVIDYLSIDTEGSEYEVLRNVDFTKRRFRLITVEHAGEQEKREAIFALLEGVGYRRVMVELSRWDDWYIHAEDTAVRQHA